MNPDIVDRLRKWAGYKTGANIGMQNWGAALSADLKDAIAEIEHLRGLAGVMSAGPSFAETKASILASNLYTSQPVDPAANEPSN